MFEPARTAIASTEGRLAECAVYIYEVLIDYKRKREKRDQMLDGSGRGLNPGLLLLVTLLVCQTDVSVGLPSRNEALGWTLSANHTTRPPDQVLLLKN